MFALVFGLAALLCALTGKGVAVGGLVTAVLGLLLGGAVLGGLSALVNDERRLDQLQNRIDDLRTSVPSTDEVRQELPSWHHRSSRSPARTAVRAPSRPGVVA